MHIEPGLVDGTKIVLSYATAAAAGGLPSNLRPTRPASKARCRS